MVLRAEIQRPSCEGKKGPGTKDELLKRLVSVGAAQRDILDSAVMLHEFFYGPAPTDPTPESEAPMKSPAMFDEIFAMLNTIARTQGETIRVLGLIKNAL